MSSGYWQAEKRREQYSTGKEATQKVSDYVTKWKAKGYLSDIPDEVPRLLEQSGRAPSYKAIAIAILKNDFSFQSIGFSRKESEISLQLMREKNRNKRQEALKL